MQIHTWERTQKRISDIIQMLGMPQAPNYSRDAGAQSKFRSYGLERGTGPAQGWNGRGGFGSSFPSPRAGAGKVSFASELQGLIEQEARRQGVASDLVKALVKVESGGRPGARSPKGALGLMQLMPGTAQVLGVNPHKPRENLSGGIRYLKAMARRFGDLDLALAAYNAGPGAVEKYKGVPPYKETRQYIQKIRGNL